MISKQSIYDIPTSRPHNHASNLLELDNGDILCCWFGGTREGKSDVSILLSKFDLETKEWNEPIVFDGDSTKSEQNPILFKNPNGEIWLVYTAQDLIYQDSATVNYRTSKDNGETWSPVGVLFSEAGSFVRNPPVILNSGEIILPAYYSAKSDNGFLADDRSVIKVSNNFGETWDEYEVPGSRGLVHMSLLKVGNKLIGLFRSRRSDNIYRTESNDFGRTWSTPKRTSLPNNNSSIQAITVDNNILVIFNNVNAMQSPPKENRPPWFDKEDMEKVNKGNKNFTDAIWGVVRTPLSLALSADGGETWEIIGDVINETDLKEEIDYPEFSYPSIIRTAQNDIHISFTYLRRYIKHYILEGKTIIK